VDAGEVMAIFCKDTMLNISPRYLRPGFAFGGSCLPKDLHAVVALARKKGIEAPLFNATSKSNKAILQALLSMIFDSGVHHIGFFGVTFKPETDDTRESPILHCIEKLLSRVRTYQKDLTITIFDTEKACIRVTAYHDSRISIAEKEEDLIRKAELIVLGPYRLQTEIHEFIINSRKPVIDLKWHRVPDSLREYEHYHCLV